MKAWYFSNEACTLRYDDDRKIKAGVTHTVDYKPVLCQQGLHASKNIMDALSYAPGPYIWRVELCGDIVHGNDKMAATERKYLWGYDATDVLWRMARLSALDVVHLWRAPDVVVRYLETGDPAIKRAAYWAAYSAADSAARSAADSAAHSAADSAAYSAAYWAADSAADSAALKKQERRLYRLIIANRP